MESTNFDKFGSRELDTAGRLLQAYAKNPCIDKDGLCVGFNPYSGYVYLYNADGDCAMLNGDEIEKWYTTPYDGHKGFMCELQDMDKSGWNQEDIDYVNELS